MILKVLWSMPGWRNNLEEVVQLYLYLWRTAVAELYCEDIVDFTFHTVGLPF